MGTVLLAASGMQAQSYMPGYIVPTAGDTVRGELENEFWEATPATLRFRPTTATEPQALRTAALQGFGFVQGRYWRRQYLTYDWPKPIPIWYSPAPCACASCPTR